MKRDRERLRERARPGGEAWDMRILYKTRQKLVKKKKTRERERQRE